jgi:hypothetical protein
MFIEINHQPSGGREWIAEITGLDPKYLFKREFLPVFDRDWSSSGKTGTTKFKLDEGKIYEVNEPWKGRRYIKVENGEIKRLDKEDVLKIFEE